MTADAGGRKVGAEPGNALPPADAHTCARVVGTANVIESSATLRA
jgi:hypothetical protein